VLDLIRVRNCPNCSKPIEYKSLGGFNNACKNNSLCKHCSVKLGHSNSPRIYPIRELSRNCPVCGTLIIYTERSGFFKGRRFNKRCNSCANKNVSVETRDKISQAKRNHWKSGIYTHIVRQSAGHKELSNTAVELGHWVVDEWYVDSRPFDIYIVDLNILIEFNGTFWHFDPRKYKAEFNHPIFGNAGDKWKSDNDKRESAENLGYICLTIWEDDWNICPNKLEFLRGLL
jgi:endogenous inhibitor of DNA gyrase (YacG/DUF329 family)